MEVTQIAGPLVLFLLMVVVGLELHVSDFRRVFASPRSVIGGTAAQLLLLPLMTWAVVGLTGLSPIFGAGAILVAVSPGAGMSNVLVAIARANTALSVTLTSVASVVSVFTLPIIASVGMRVALGEDGRVEIPVFSLVGQLILTLLIPIGLGMWLRTSRPARAEAIAPILHRVVMGAIILFVVAGVLLADDEQIDFTGSRAAFGAAALWTVSAMVLGWGVAWLLGLDETDRFTFLIEFSARNIAVASIVAMSGLDRIDLTLFSGIYAAVGYPLAALAVFLRRRRLSGRARAANGGTSAADESD